MKAKFNGDATTEILNCRKNPNRASGVSGWIPEQPITALTQAPIQIGYCSSVLPEFGRWQDVQRLFGIKRGTLYGLIGEGKIRSITLCKPGRKFGCRLIHLQSVRDFLQALMAKQVGPEVFR